MSVVQLLFFGLRLFRGARLYYYFPRHFQNPFSSAKALICSHNMNVKMVWGPSRK